MIQSEIAKKEMANWLSHPGELGKPPRKIILTKSFKYLKMTYYIFKFKKGLFSKWMIGVCGGYEEGTHEHCGHIFSELKEYQAESEQSDSIAMINTIRDYWIERARRL